MARLDGKIAWITGAGSGIGEAASLALAAEGARVVLTGRRADALEAVAKTITEHGGTALVAAGDVTRPELAGSIVETITSRFGRLDILFNNAGSNVTARRWDQLSGGGIDQVIDTNLKAAFYCAAAALRPMRKARDGVLIHTASWAGKYISPLSGPAYTAAKHAVVAMSQTINMEDYGNGIRSTAILPAEIATPILDTRPQPPSQEERAKMLQPNDLAELILFIATRPASVCLNEIVISPTWNRIYTL